MKPNKTQLPTKQLWPICIVICVMATLSGCKKKPVDTIKTMAITELPAAYTLRNAGLVEITTDNRLLVLGNGMAGNKLYYSDAEHNNWQPLDITPFITNLKVLSNQKVLLSTWAGILVLDLKTLQTTATSYKAINTTGAFQQTDDGTVYYFETSKGKLFRSNDNGMTWTEPTAANVSIGANTGCRLFAKQNKLYLTHTLSNSLYTSDDKGESFTVLSNAFGGAEIFFSPGGEMLSSDEKISTDGGATWNKWVIDPNDPTQHVSGFVFTSDGKTIALPAYNASRLNGLWLSANGLNGFKRLGSFDVLTAKASGTTVVIAGMGLCESKNNGADWRSIGPERIIDFDKSMIGADKNLLVHDINADYWPLQRLVNNQWKVDMATGAGEYFEAKGYRLLFQESVGYYSTDEGASWTMFTHHSPGLLIAQSFVRRNGELYAITRYAPATPGIPERPSKIFKFNKASLLFEAIQSNITLTGGAIVENATGNFFTIVSTYIDGLVIATKQYKSTDGGATWFEQALEYQPICFNKENNFVATGLDGTFWFSDVADSKIYNYKFDPAGHSGVKPVFFDADNYLYASVSGYFYKSKSPYAKP